MLVAVLLAKDWRADALLDTCVQTTYRNRILTYVIDSFDICGMLLGLELVEKVEVLFA